jgi:hypothetical protein
MRISKQSLKQNPFYVYNEHMKNKILNELKNKTVWIAIAAGAALALIYALIVKPVYLCFINGLTFVGFLYLLIGLMRWSWAEGDFTFFSWKQIHGSYRKWREGRREERKGSSNPFLYAGILTVIVSILLSIAY